MHKLIPVLFALVALAPCAAHPGGLDSKGGHNDRKNGGYHYHRTPPAAAPTTTARPSTGAPAANAPSANLAQTSVPTTTPAASEPSDPRLDELFNLIRELRDEVKQLKARVARMEGRPGSFVTVASLASWRRIQQGTTLPQVRAMLGDPERIDWPLWRYPNGGWVAFVGEGNEAMVMSSAEPKSVTPSPATTAP